MWGISKKNYNEDTIFYIKDAPKQEIYITYFRQGIEQIAGAILLNIHTLSLANLVRNPLDK